MKRGILSFYEKHQKGLFLILTILLGIYLLGKVSDYQLFIAPGDHGRDFYCFEKTLEGQVPYQDYWWVYGPIMPYYYALFYKIFGITIPSIILGKHFLIIVSAIFFYLTLCLFASPVLAFLGTGWYYLFHPDFFYTYNHTGGIAVILMLAYLIMRYLQKQKIQYLYLMALGFFLLYLIKINFGVFALICCALSVLAIDLSFKNRIFSKEKIQVLVLCLIISPIITFAIYYALLHKLPFYAIRQCLPYLAEDHPYNSSVFASMGTIIATVKENMTKSMPDFILAVLINLSLGQTILLLTKKDKKLALHLPVWLGKKQILLTYAILSFFYLCFIHEYMVSGVMYRSFWAKPFVFLLMFITLALGASNFSKKMRGLFYLPLALILCLKMIAVTSELSTVKVPSQFINIPRASVYVSNPENWIKTVEMTTHLLQTNLKDDETFFAFPYDPLYYYLTGKTSPTRQLIFFEHINIPQEQEEKIIQDLEKNHVNWILVSSRSNALEPGLGRFGVTYCQTLGKYIQENFTVEAQIGDWVNEPLWAHNHGTKILRRKQ